MTVLDKLRIMTIRVRQRGDLDTEQHSRFLRCFMMMKYPGEKYHQGLYPHLPWESVNREAGLSKVQKRLTVVLPPPAVLDK